MASAPPAAGANRYDAHLANRLLFRPPVAGHRISESGVKMITVAAFIVGALVAGLILAVLQLAADTDAAIEQVSRER